MVLVTLKWPIFLIYTCNGNGRIQIARADEALLRASSSIACWELAGLLSSKCRGRSRTIINMHNGRVSVEVGRGKSLICITVESMTSSIVIT